MSDASKKAADFLELTQGLKSEGRSEQQIAEYLGLSVSQLRSHISVANVELRNAEPDE